MLVPLPPLQWWKTFSKLQSNQSQVQCISHNVINGLKRKRRIYSVINYAGFLNCQKCLFCNVRFDIYIYINWKLMDCQLLSLFRDGETVHSAGVFRLYSMAGRWPDSQCCSKLICVFVSYSYENYFSTTSRYHQLWVKCHKCSLMPGAQDCSNDVPFSCQHLSWHGTSVLKYRLKYLRLSLLSALCLSLSISML